MKCFILCGELSIYFIFPLLMPIFFALRSLISTKRNTFSFQERDSPIFFALLSLFVYLFGGCLELFSNQLRFSTINQAKDQLQDRKLKPLITIIPFHQQKSKSKERKYYIHLFSASFLLCCMYTSRYILNSKSTNLEENYLYTHMRVGLIIFNLILSIFVLKYPIYRHHFLSIIFMIIGLILVSFTDFWTTPIPAITCFLINIIDAIFDVQIKLMSNHHDHSIFITMFLIGIIGSFMCLIFLCFTWAIPCFDTKYLSCINNTALENVIYTLTHYFTLNTSEKILLMIAYEIVNAGCSICLILTLHHFTPLHRCMSDSIHVFILWIIEYAICPNENQYNRIIWSILGYVLIVLSSLIYNEMIILNFWTLDEYTKINITKRGQLEQILAERGIQEIDLDNNSI